MEERRNGLMLPEVEELSAAAEQTERARKEDEQRSVDVGERACYILKIFYPGSL